MTATLVTYGLLAVMVYAVARRHYVLLPFPRATALHTVVAGALYGAAMMAVTRMVAAAPFAVLIFGFGVGATVYVVALVVLGELTGQERAAVLARFKSLVGH